MSHNSENFYQVADRFETSSLSHGREFPSRQNSQVSRFGELELEAVVFFLKRGLIKIQFVVGVEATLRLHSN